MRLNNGGKSCKELEVRIDGKLFLGLAGVYDLQSYIYNEKSAYVNSEYRLKTLRYNAQAEYWEV